jgi:hypothetical protein
VNLENLKKLFSDQGCLKIYLKPLAENDNSKNQVYFGGSFEILNILPISEVYTEDAGDWERERFKATIRFSWINDDGKIYPAPRSKLILYPKYPEVRFSGFLAGCEKAPSELMAHRISGRILFFGVSRDGVVLGYVAGPNSEIAKNFQVLSNLEQYGVFKILELKRSANNKQKLLKELNRIHNREWIKSKRLDANGKEIPCLFSNCGGYTLEAELGVIPNGYAEPDYLGWEIKQFGVKKFTSINSAVITLMTPEPTDGYYATEGTQAFIRKYGYDDLRGRSDRMNFGGIHKSDVNHSRTNLTLQLIGFDKKENKIRNANGRIALIDKKGNDAASWSFASMLKHWSKKHNQACYIPSISMKVPERKYQYGSKIILGVGTDFQLFLKEMSLGNIYYDPGIKMENISVKPVVKNRSQFRTTAKCLKSLYFENEIVDLDEL